MNEGAARGGGFAVAMAAAAAAGVALRAAHLAIPMRYDEVLTFMEYASPGWLHASTAYDTPNNHVLHTLMVWASTSLIGSSPMAIRLPAFLAGCLVPPTAAWLALRRHGPGAALLAGAFTAAAPALIEYSTNARGYTLVMLFTLVAVLFAQEVLERPRALLWTGLAAVGVLGLYTVPVMLTPGAGVMLWVAANRVARARGARASDRSGSPGREAASALLPVAATAVAAGVLTAALYLPIVTANGLDALVGNRFVAPMDWGDFLAALPGAALGVLAQWTRGIPLVLVLVLATGVVAAALLVRARPYPFPLGAALAVAAAGVLVATRNPGEARVWLWALPLVLVAAAAGWAELLARLPGVTGTRRLGWEAMVGAAWLALQSGWLLMARPVHASLETGGFLEAEAVARLLQERMATDDGLVTDFVSFEPLRYYLIRGGVPPTAVRRSPGGDGVAWVVLNRNEPHREEAARKAAAALGIPLDTGRPVAVFGDVEVYGFRSAG